VISYVNDDLWKMNNNACMLQGKGTLEEPYEISNAEDLKWFRDSVNAGESYEGVYFEQTADIDLLGEEWIPIGIWDSDNYFMGVYDGGTHSIQNLIINVDDNNDKVDNNGFFGRLGGMVVNLGIASGEINGDHVGAIASHAIGNKAAIINCYNKAVVSGAKRAGGICDNFNGVVVNCVNYGEVTAPFAAGITSYNTRALVNTYSETDTYVDATFKGINIQIIDVENCTDLIDYLNRGIDYLESQEMFDYELLKRWTEK